MREIIKSCVRYIFASLFGKSLVKQEKKIFFNFISKALFILDKFSDIQMSWRHQMPKHEIPNTFY